MSAPVFLLNHSVGVPVSIKDSGPELEDTYLAVAARNVRATQGGDPQHARRCAFSIHR